MDVAAGTLVGSTVDEVLGGPAGLSDAPDRAELQDLARIAGDDSIPF